MIDVNRSLNLAVTWRAGCLHVPSRFPALVAALERQWLLLFGWLLLATPVGVHAQFNYTVTNGTVTITGYTDTNGVVVIPDTITGLPVTAIGGHGSPWSDALTPWPSLTSVTIPNSVISIEGGAFVGSSSLTNIMVDPLNSVYSSADGVLFNQSQTTLVEYPGGKFGHYTIPNSVTRIGTAAFVDCFWLTSVTIPNSVTDIGDSAFSGCDSLTKVTIGNGVTSIGNSAFSTSNNGGYVYGCPLMNITIPNSVTKIGAGAFAGCSELAHVALGDGLTTIADNAFTYCSSLANVNIPTNVTGIGSSAFSGCTTLTSVTIPKGVTSIGSDAFIGCQNLSAISVETNNPAYSSVGGVLFDESQTTLIEYPDGKIGSFSIPNSVTCIGPRAFQYSRLTNVSIGNSVTNIGSGFYHCINLTAISVETNNPAYTSVAGVLFNQSQTTLIEYPRGKVGSYSIPNGVTNIGPGAFIGCISLTGVTIPSSVTSIGGTAFFACMGLRNVFFEANPPAVGQYAFGATLEWEGRLVGPDPATAYFLPGSTGWSTNYGGIPTAFWTLSHPLILNNTPGFGVQSNGFSYTVSWATNLSVVVEATSDLANPVWSPLATNALSGGTFYFSDLQWTNYPSRFYRVRSQ